MICIAKKDDDRRALDLARDVLHDMGELARCEFRVRKTVAEGLPVIVILWPALSWGGHPALGIPLTSLATGQRFSDDKLRRLIRTRTETYLAKAHGVIMASDKDGKQKAS